MFPDIFQKLIRRFSSLPSVGPKMAERLVLFLFKSNKKDIEEFAGELHHFATEISFCRRCFHIAQGDVCSICSDAKRNSEILCVVEDPLDVIAFEKTKKFSGVYHVLGGNLKLMSPDEIGKLKINELLERVKKEKTKEVILATNPTTDGDTTALYLARTLRPLKIKISRIARGMPTGGDIEYADEVTLSSALESRKEV